MKDLQRLLPYIIKYKKMIIGGFVLVTISNICSTYVPRVVGLTIDLLGKDSVSQVEVLKNLLMIIGLTLASGLFMFFTRKTIIVASRMIEYDLRRDFLDHVQKRKMSFFYEYSPGTLMAYATNDITAAREFLGPAIMYTANSVTTFIFVLFFMLNIDPLLTLLALLPLPLITYFVHRLGKEIHKSFKAVQEQYAVLSSRSQETFSGIRVVKSHVREEYENEHFNILSKDYFEKNLRLARIQSIMMPVLMVLVGVAQMLVLGYGGWKVMNGKSSLGDLTQFFIYINMLIWPVTAIGWITNVVQRASASMARLSVILDNVADDELIINNEKLAKDTRDTSIANHQLSIDFIDVSLKYKENSPTVLCKISFSIKKGESLGITGPVGSGKTTIINLLPSLIETSGGNIMLDGKNIREIDKQQLRNMIAVVPQDQFLFSTTIKENISFGNKSASNKDIEKAVWIACLDEDIRAFPDNYDTMLGERGITLSGGQKQRLAIARAIINNPSILILDDALSAVDAGTEEKILTRLQEFMKDRTTIIVSHRISTIINCNNIIVLDKGEIIESGTHNDLLAAKGKYEKIYSRQKLEEEINYQF